MGTKNLTCTVCPIGCRMKITTESDLSIKVEGNTCIRGKKYALAEMTNPVRTLTSGIKIIGQSKTVPDLRVLPVKTDKPIPKAKLMDAMKIIKTIKITPPISTGQVIIENFITNGTNLIACRDI